MIDKIEYLEKEMNKWAEENSDLIEKFKTLYESVDNIAKMLLENDELRNALSDIVKRLNEDKNDGRQN